MTRTIYYTATTLDGFLADEQDSLAWLFVQRQEEGGGPMGYDAFMEHVGALAMGSTTYQWVLGNLAQTGDPWPYTQKTFVFTHQDLAPITDDVEIVSGPVTDHLERLRDLAGDRDVWVVGGGDLAAQFAEAGALDQMMLSIAPVTLGAGRPLFPRRWNLRLVRHETNGAFLCAWYDVVGPGDWPEPTTGIPSTP